MIFWIACLGGLVVAYCLGAIPTGYLAGHLLKGVDLREHGSTSTGATNVLRTLGKRAFWAVLFIDVLKGVAAITFALWYFPWLSTLPFSGAPSLLAASMWSPWGVCFAGLAALLGHSRSIWLKFKGGKSVATGLGVLIAMSWPVGFGSLLAFGVALVFSRIMSLSSMIGALTAMILISALDHPLPYRLLVIVGGTYVIVRHSSNIRRLLAGTEPRVGQAGSKRHG